MAKNLISQPQYKCTVFSRYRALYIFNFVTRQRRVVCFTPIASTWYQLDKGLVGALYLVLTLPKLEKKHLASAGNGTLIIQWIH